MTDAIIHRGPDDEGFYCEGLIGLGHRRLSILDLSSSGHQPMSNNDSSIWISTNSEIYNYKELKNELDSQYSFRTKSDTEVLLKSYEAWGIDCLEKLRGMFAFAMWDKKYKELYPFTEDPLFWIHLNVDYPFNLTGVLYFPKISNNFELQKEKIQLYCKQVFDTPSKLIAWAKII